MSRFIDHGDDDSPEAVLAYGRWKRNSRAVLKSKRGRATLTAIRAALLALPEKRLIESALCTVGGPGKRALAYTETEQAGFKAGREAWHLAHLRRGEDQARSYAEWSAQNRQDARDEEREDITGMIENQGEGVCLWGAYLWHQKVLAGMYPLAAFESLPTTLGDEDDDPLEETARLAENAGVVFTLAWNLAYKNDEEYAGMTPEQRHAAFVAWIDAELASAT